MSLCGDWQARRAECPGWATTRSNVEEVRYRIRSFAPDEFRPPLCIARCWTSVRKAKEGEVKGDIFAFLTCERTPRSAMPLREEYYEGTAGSAKRAHVRSGNEISSGAERARTARPPNQTAGDYNLCNPIDNRFGRLKGSMFISSWTTTSSTRHPRSKRGSPDSRIIMSTSHRHPRQVAMISSSSQTH